MADFTERSWAADFLGRLAVPPSRGNELAVLAWMHAEGGHFANEAWYNPLNTTQRMPGSTAFNSVGVQAYPDYEIGMAATVKTATNGYYPEILAALARGDSGRRTIEAVGRSVWGTGLELIRRTYDAMIIPPLDDSPPANPEALRGRPTVRPTGLAAATVARAPEGAPPVVQPVDVLAFFERNDGLAERTGSNDNWLTDWWGLHDAWCAMTVSRALMEAGFRSDDSYSTMLMPGIQRTQTKGWQYVPAMARCFADAGWFGGVPRLGAAAIAIWSDWSWRDPSWQMPGDHVCSVELVLDGAGNVIPWDDNGFPTDPGAVASVVTWDGNISNRIMRAHRSAGTYFGYGYPPYAGFTGSEEAELTGEEKAQLRYTKDVVDEIKSMIEGLAEGDEGGRDAWENGRRRFVMITKAGDERSEAFMAKLDELLSRADGAGGGTPADVDYARIRREVAEELVARLKA